MAEAGKLITLVLSIIALLGSPMIITLVTRASALGRPRVLHYFPIQGDTQLWAATSCFFVDRTPHSQEGFRTAA